MLLTIYTEDNCCVSASACLYPVRLPSSLECNSCLEWPCHSVALTLTWWSGLILWHTHWQTCRLPIHGSMLSITYTLGFRGQKYSRDKQDTVMFPVDVNLLVSIVNCSPWSKYDNWELPDTWLSPMQPWALECNPKPMRVGPYAGNWALRLAPIQPTSHVRLSILPHFDSGSDIFLKLSISSLWLE